MIIHQDGEEWFIDVERLQKDLEAEHLELHAISKHGELVIDRWDGHDDKFDGREVYMARPTGYPNAYVWAGMDFEFCRSVLIGDRQ